MYLSDKGAHCIFQLRIQPEYVYLALREGRDRFVSTRVELEPPATATAALAPPIVLPPLDAPPTGRLASGSWLLSRALSFRRPKMCTNSSAEPSINPAGYASDDGLEGGNSPASLARQQATGGPHASRAPPMPVITMATSNSAQRAAAFAQKATSRLSPEARTGCLSDQARSYRGPYSPDAATRV